MTGSLSMIFLDATVVGVSLPTIQTHLDLTTPEAAWIVNAFLVAFASSLAIGGRLADRFGRLTVFRTAMVLFAAASLACALAGTATQIIASRALQGLGAGLMQPASTAIVIGAYPEGQRGRAMATYFGVALLFLMAGPVIGGLVLSVANWPWIFLLNLPVAVAALGLSMHLRLPARAGGSRGIDPLGCLLLLGGLPSLVLGLEWLGHPPPHAAWIPIALAATGLTLSAVFVIRSSRVPSPLLNVRLIASRTMFGQTMILALVSLIMSAQAVYGAIFLQESLGFTPLQAGLGSMPLLVPVVLVIHSAGKLYDRIGAARPVFVGLAVTLAGLCIEVIGVIQSSYPVLAVGMAAVGAGSTYASTPANTDVLSHAPDAQRGEVSGLVQTTRQLGSAIGIVVCVLAIGWTVAASLPEAMPRGPLADVAARAVEGDVEAIATLGTEDPDLANRLKDARRSGMAAAFIVQALAAVVGIFVAQVCLRPFQRPPAAPSAD
jgi:EmrB/QacA subfamily drug resistance transporter